MRAHLLRIIYLAVLILVTAGPRTAAAEVPATGTDVQYLSGRGADDAVEWDFLCTAGRRSGEWTKIHVPSCWEQEGFGTYGYGLTLRSKAARKTPLLDERGKYRFRFAVPTQWQGRVVSIVFDGSMTDTEVWINGQSAGIVHQGAFYRFKYNISALLKYGASNLLEVTVAKESANASVNEAERRADYWNFGGIFRPVFLEALPSTAVERVAIDAQANGEFTAQVHLLRAAENPLSLQLDLVDADGARFGESHVTEIPAGSQSVVVHARFTGSATWTAETPHLYTARFALSEEGTLRHALVQRFGFRTFEVRPRDGLYLNGRKITLKGTNRHSFRPETARTLSQRLNIEDVRLIRELNMNAVRMSHYPPDVDFLEACDEIGLYVLDELGGWHGHYDTPTGRKLIREMVTRDANHPSILFWDNGNEGGWNTENDGEFAKWDQQRRPVLHPQQLMSGVETMHYRNYGETETYLKGPEIFMPTEFLHGLYDGGQGAGLRDFWELMRQSPLSAGGFLWSFADEGVMRTDQGGRIDNVGDFAPDGIVGPHHEKEGSFFTVRQIWSPIQVMNPSTLPADFDGVLQVENRFDFINLAACSFAWELGRFAGPGGGSGHFILGHGEMPGAPIAPHCAGQLQLALPAGWREADVLYITARNPRGEALWTWSWALKESGTGGVSGQNPQDPGSPAPESSRGHNFRQDDTHLIVSLGSVEYRFDRSTGEISGVSSGKGHSLSLRNGPRLMVARRGDRTADGTVDASAPKGADRVYVYQPGASSLEKLTTRLDGENVIVEANYRGPLRQARWSLSSAGSAVLEYHYIYEGVVELLGIYLDYPESEMKSIRWLGWGPYRVWQNRTLGTTLDVWENSYNDALPGETFSYPEFKGYFRDWQWARFETTEGSLTLENKSGAPYLGVYTPRDGTIGKLFEMPPTGLAVLDVIPAMRNKVSSTDLMGPESQAVRVHGEHHGVLTINFAPR